LHSETLNLRGNAAEAIKAPKDQIPTTIAPRGTEHVSGHGTWVSVYQRSSGETDLIHMPYLVKSHQPITPEEAEQQVVEYLQREPDKYNRVTLGIGYVGTEKFMPRPSTYE
jgi:hypothetical protein